MSQKVFGDADLTVHTMRNPTLSNERGEKYVYDGLVFQVNCQDCETPNQIGLRWSEVRTLLEGGLTQGVERTNSGWQLTMQCQNRADGWNCNQHTTIAISDEELEKHASLEVARRERNARSGGGVPQQRAAPRAPMRRR